MIKNFNILLISTILFGLLASVFISKYNLDTYDVNANYGDRIYHKMIKADAYRYLSHGAEIKDQVAKGKNFFTSGREHFTKYLPPRLAAAYYYFFDINFFEDKKNKKIKIGNHFYYLLFQSLIYYFSILFLYFSIQKSFDKKIILISIIFLCFEPTIFQYHGTFWSESFFFSFQIIVMALIFRENKSPISYAVIGLFLGILSLQKQLGIFYIIPVLIYFFAFDKKNFLNKFLLIFLGFFLVQLFLGLSNYYRSGAFYVMTSDTKVEMHRSLVERVMVNQLGISINVFNKNEGMAAHEWILKKNIKVNYEVDHTHTLNRLFDPLPEIKNFMYYRRIIINESDRVIYDKFIRKRTFMYIANYPIEFAKEAFKGAVHSPLLNPFHIYSDHNFVSGEVYYRSKKHDELVPIRVIYSGVIYFFVLMGLVFFLKKKDYKNLFFLLISTLYFYTTIFWHGNTRYFVPCLIYLSFFFGAGFNFMLSLIKIKSNVN